MIRKKKCSCCETIVLAVNKDGFCEECQEKIENGEFIVCENEGCNKKVGITAKNKMCKNCNLEQNVCLECGRVSDTGLDSEGSCSRCNGTALNECEKCHEKVDYILDENNHCEKCKDAGGTTIPPKNIMPMIAAGVIVLFGIGFFLFPSNNETASETKIAKKQEASIKKDSTPDAFSFSNVNNANLNSEIKSNEISINGINTQVPISINNGKYSINGNSWSNSNGVVSNGSKIKVKHLSSNTYSSVNKTVLTVENISASFESRTKSKPRIKPTPLPKPIPIKVPNCTPTQKALGEC